MTRPKLLDLFCSEGGASMGYHMAGFDVTGVDIEPKERYPFEMAVANALQVDLDGYDAYAASPPCQGYSRLKSRYDASKWPLLIAPIRERLEATGKPYVIENVVGAESEMKSPICLCGSSFGLRVRRHRLFEANFGVPELPCEHAWQDGHKPYSIYEGKSRGAGLGRRASGVQPVHGGNHNVGGNSYFYKSVAMGIDWMTEHGLNESIPPAYTRYVGKWMLEVTGQYGKNLETE